MVPTLHTLHSVGRRGEIIYNGKKIQGYILKAFTSQMRVTRHEMTRITPPPTIEKVYIRVYILYELICMYVYIHIMDTYTHTYI